VQKVCNDVPYSSAPCRRGRWSLEPPAVGRGMACRNQSRIMGRRRPWIHVTMDHLYGGRRAPATIGSLSVGPSRAEPVRRAARVEAASQLLYGKNTTRSSQTRNYSVLRLDDCTSVAARFENERITTVIRRLAYRDRRLHVILSCTVWKKHRPDEPWPSRACTLTRSAMSRAIYTRPYNSSDWGMRCVANVPDGIYA